MDFCGYFEKSWRSAALVLSAAVQICVCFYGAICSPEGMDHFFEEAAERRMPLQGAPPTDPVVFKELAAFTGKYGYEFAEFPTDP